MAAVSLSRLLYRGAALDPAATAVEDGTTRIPYADLLRRVESTAAALQGMVPAGGRIALCAANHAEHLVTYLAILIAGCVWVPLNPANGRELNSTLVDKAQPDLLCVDRQSVDCVPAMARLCRLDRLPAAKAACKPQRRAAGDLAAIKFTGGTSGEPKGVMQTHGNMLAVIENLQAFYRFGPHDCYLAAAPLTHGSSHYLLPVLAAGGRHRFPAERSPESILAALRDGTTLTFMPPTLIYRLLQSDGLSPAQFSQLRHLTYGAAPMPVDRIAEAQRAFGPRISALYGLTEAPLTIAGLGTDDMQLAERRGSVGQPCVNSRVRIVDENGVEVGAGTIGRVEARGPIVMQGYLDEARLTDAAIRDGWLSTGDLGSVDAEGYLTLAGRSHDVIITGGFNVYPAEIEHVLARIPGIRECCVYGVPDDYWGERIEAAVVAPSGIDDTTIAAIVRRALGPVRTPKAMHRVDELPVNAVGKVVRRDVARWLANRQRQASGPESS